MTFAQVFAATVLCLGLIAAGVLTGWTLRGRFGRSAAVPARPPLAQIQIQMLGHTIRTDAIVDAVQLESLANGIGMTVTRLPTTRLQ